MKNIIKKISILFVTLLIKTNIVLAQDPGAMLGKTGSTAGLKNVDTSQLVGQIIKGFIGFMGTVFMLLIVYAGFLWMTAQGNEEKITKAKNTIQSSVIGLLIVALSYVIVQFVFDTLIGAGL